MKHLSAIFALVLMVGALGNAAYADTITQQIDAAIATGDYKTAQSLISQNPDQGGATEVKILGIADRSVSSNPQSTIEAATLGSNISPYIDTTDAPAIAGDTKKLVQDVLAASQAKDGSAPGSGYTPDNKIAVLNSALTIAQSGPVAASDPTLAGWVQAQLDDYADANDVLLAQVPLRNFSHNGNGNRFYQPQFVPPPNSGGSPL